ncbi:hypothetical protein KMP11_03250 [Gemella sp. zg-570]|uniref:hypothetical protein n=1 Tax=Gemella sp. zg-570 TaxID=2840371 RepID=UPI001C0BEACA|nr:hypothetical protein [Gemella sp. zg-570]QWQ39355.1 hypothetical protein KMP11_03250 [Gemella sp. zg-570]
MLKIEILKVLKRKLNYIYFVFLLLVSGLSAYKYQSIINYLEVDFETYLYNYVLKVLLILVAFILGLNIIFSYREDYKTKVNNIIYNSKVTNFSNIFSKLLVKFINFTLYYFLILAINLAYFHYIKIFDLISFLKNVNYLYSLGLACAILLFVANFVLFILSMFNNTNLAVAISLLFFAGSKYVVAYLVSFNNIFKYLKYTFTDIHNIAIAQIFLEQKNTLLLTIITLIINSLILFLLSLILKWLKQK